MHLHGVLSKKIKNNAELPGVYDLSWRLCFFITSLSPLLLHQQGTTPVKKESRFVYRLSPPGFPCPACQVIYYLFYSYLLVFSNHTLTQQLCSNEEYYASLMRI